MLSKRPERLKLKVEKICDVCGKSFITSNSYLKRCSKECTDKWHREEYKPYIWTYGITSEDYNKMFEDQKGCCKICKRHQSELKSKLNIDHKYELGYVYKSRSSGNTSTMRAKPSQIRGLLCNQCNQALGLLKENPDTIKSMLEYVA